MAVRMHTEYTDDPDCVVWVVRTGWPLGDGTWDATHVTDLPEVLVHLLTTGALVNIHAADERIYVQRGSAAWSEIAADVDDAIRALCRTEDSDSLTRAQTIVDGTIGAFARSHDGNIQVLSLDDGCANVEVSGACIRCPALSRSIESGVLQQLNAHGFSISHVQVHTTP